ncbi:uncharacterized protein [Malus domestica]|uniref:uncharacterized protein isoform X2 n=1 Tax=Malus domestica TaxID=3750 RepID=UPI00397544A2
MASYRVDSIDDAIDLEYESGGSKCEAESEGDQEEVGIEEIHPIQKPETARESGIELHHYFASPSSLSVSVMSSTSALSSRLSNFHRLTDSQDHLSFREGVNSRPACPSIVSWPGIKTGRTPRSSRVYGLFGGGKKGNNERGDDAASKAGVFSMQNLNPHRMTTNLNPSIPSQTLRTKLPF